MLLKQILEILDSKMTTPTPYGWFHILSILLAIATTLFLAKSKKLQKKECIENIVFNTSVIVLLLEIYKQINYTFQIVDGNIIFDYQWYAFPFQFCSMPMYIGAMTKLCKNNKAKECLYAFLATYAIFAGVCVMVYPTTVFIDTIGINIQTMINHASMIVIGVYLLTTGYVKPSVKTLFNAAKVFAVAISVAILMNEAAYFSGLLNTEEFNMFFISPHCEPALPVYSSIQELLPFPFCLLVYVAVFTIAAGIPLIIAKIFKRKEH